MQQRMRTFQREWMSRWAWSTWSTSKRSTTPTTSSSSSDYSGSTTGDISVNNVSLIRLVTWTINLHRVRYHNLKRERSLNALSLEELSSLWVPPLVFENTADNEAVEGTKDSEVCSQPFSLFNFFFDNLSCFVWMILSVKLQLGHSDKGGRFHPKQSWGGRWGEILLLFW